MLKKIILLLIVTTLYSAEITNIEVQQRTDGTGIIDVTYDLIDSEGIYPSFNVSIEMSIDGSEYTTLNPSDLSGDIGENVIPGVSRNIQIQAPADTYSNNVVVKIIASATIVTGELPFTMISISSIEGVSSYQNETIDYNFQMMQYEMTNADLVTFLETYDFELNEDGERVYNCNDHTEYFNTGNNNSDGCEDCIYGCTEMGAANYNPNANYHTDCIYDWEVGCTDSNANNYNDEVIYDNCSCFNTYSPEQGDVYSWVTMPGCNWTELQDSLEAQDLASYFSEWFTYLNNQKLEINLCDDANAQNFPWEIEESILNYQNLITGGNADNSCWSFTGFDSCIYEDDCDMSYLDPPNGNSDTDYGTANISDFNTHDISYEGLSFVIESGQGAKPAIFNYNNCVDGVIIGLMLDYYGLRLPTGSEWTKAARQDNNRCWPWMNTNCDIANETYCSSEYSCLTQEEFEACEVMIQENFNSCQTQCNDDMWDCQADCQDSFEDTGGGNSESCESCMNNPDNWSQCNMDPCSEGCPCCDDCSFGEGSGGADMECFQGCDATECMLECGNTYGDSYSSCGGEEMQQCNNSYQDCTDNHNWDTCIQITQEELEWVLENPAEYDQHGFIHAIYTNKFHNLVIYDEWNSDQPLEFSDVGQYPEGLSPFGLYDMIGNAPELVKHDNSLWLAGLNPEQDSYPSFCAQDGNIFGTGSNLTHAQLLGGYPGSYFNLFTLRLARTTQ